ncbi:MAG: hypothetical protein ACOYX1_16195 [Acidobacteriota bacterium]
MSLSLEQLLHRLEDPATPVVWLDPALPAQLWAELPPAAAARGFHVLNLGDAGPVFDLSSLLAAFGRLLPGSIFYDHSLPSLRAALLNLKPQARPACLVLFPDPDALRQNDESAFEDLIELIENVDDLRRSRGWGGLKAVVRD